MARNDGNNKTYPMLEGSQAAAKPSTPTAHLLNLLVKDPTDAGRSPNNPRVGVNKHTLDKVSRGTSQEIMDADAIMQLLPDLELVETVMVGSILSPKDLAETDLTFISDPSIFDSEIARHLLEPIETHFKKDYKINDRLDLILRDMLFRKGASVHIILPENVMDRMVNGERSVSMESYSMLRKGLAALAPMGYLGHPKSDKISMESWNIERDNANRIAGDPNMLVTDNFDILKGPRFSQRIREMRISDKLRKHHVSMEAQVESHKFTNDEIEQLYKRSRNGNSEHTQVISAPQYMSRQSVGHPLPLMPPMESVIPIFMQGRPHEHIAYFLLVDQNGYPVSKDSTRDFYGEIQAGWKSGSSNDGNSEILRLTREALGANASKQDYEVDEIQRTYNSIIVNDLNNRLRNGMYDQEVSVGLSEEIARIMVYRNWKQKCTQLVFVPAELCVYMAFDYNNNGVGETLLARSKMIATMRSTLLMADTVGGMRNAVGRKKVRITLDPDDIDPEQTISNIQSTIMESAHRAFPLAAPDPTQAMDHLIRSGFDFEINTNGADYAETKVEFDDYNTNQQAGNPDLQDRLRRMHISGMGVPPEKVDPMSSPDFATSAVQNDLVMSRRVKEKQKVFCQHWSKFIQTYTRHSSILRQKLAVIIKQNIGMIPEHMQQLTVDDMIDDFISSVEVTLPAPDTTQHEKQAEALESYNRLLDTALESYVTADLFPDDVLQVPGLAESMINNTKAYFRRQFLAQNNILPELNVLTEMNGDKPAFSLLDYMASQQESMGKAFLEFAKAQQATKKKFSTAFAAVIAGGEETEGYGGGDDAGGGDASFGDDTDSGDDLDAFGSDTTPAPDEDAVDLDGLESPVEAAGTDTGEQPAEEPTPDAEEEVDPNAPPQEEEDEDPEEPFK